MMEPGIRTRLTNLLAMVAAPEKYDKNVKLKFPFEFYLKKTLEFVKNIKVTASTIAEALENADPTDVTLIQDALNTAQGFVGVPIDLTLLNAIGTYANVCVNTLVTTQAEFAFHEIGGEQYEYAIKDLYNACIHQLNTGIIPYIAAATPPYTFLPINTCYNNDLSSSFDVCVYEPPVLVFHFSMHISDSIILLVATKTGPLTE